MAYNCTSVNSLTWKAASRHSRWDVFIRLEVPSSQEFPPPSLRAGVLPVKIVQVRGEPRAPGEGAPARKAAPVLAGPRADPGLAGLEQDRELAW